MTTYEYTNQYTRSKRDLYIEEQWCSELLFKKVQLKGIIHDPACGTGNILRSAWNAGYENAHGTDLIEGADYLQNETIFDNIVTNPPYNLCEAFIKKAIETTRYKIAMITRLAFLEGQARYEYLYKVHKPNLVLVFSRRPSMPPIGVKRGGGKTAYCWIVWDNETKASKTEMDWII